MARAIDADALDVHSLPMDMGGCLFIDDVTEMIANAPTIEAKQEWISVKDRLPEIGQNVLVCDVDPDSDCGIRVVSLECDEKGTYWDDGDGWWFEPEDMSHWMPLPEEPEWDGE